MLPESSPPGPASLSAAWPTARAEAVPAPAALLCTGAEPGRLHEFHARAPEDAATAAAAALLIAAASAPRSPLIWLRCEAAERRCGKLYGPGLSELGIDPARLLVGVLPDELAVLKAGADALRSGSAGAVLLELHGAARRFDLTSSRRLALAAGATGTLALVLRVKGEAQPSAAWQRWSVASAPSRPLAARAPGAPVFALELSRSRAGPAGASATFHWRAGSLSDQPAPETEDALPKQPLSPVQTLARRPVPLPSGRSLPGDRHAA